MTLKKIWHHGWKVLLLTSAVVLPLPLSVACTNTAALRVYGVDYEKAAEPEIPGNIPAAYADMHLNQQWPFSLPTLNIIADQLSAGTVNTNGVKENDMPWRGGLAYESFSQTISLLRAYAAMLGWDPLAEQAELNKTRTGESNMTYLQDADLTSKSNAQLRAEFHSPLSDAYLNNARQWVAATAEDPWLDSFEHQIGAFSQFGDLDVTYDSPYIAINWITHPAIDAATISGDFFPARESKDLRLYSWNDPQTPGVLKVGLTGVNYDTAGEKPVGRLTRLFTMAKRALVYPIIEKTIYEREFIPLLRLALNKFLQLFDDTTIALITSFTALKIAPDLISMVNFLKTAAPTVDAARQTTILQQLNNGTHHLLATAAFWKGFDSTFTRRNLPIAGFAATAPLTPIPGETLTHWQYDDSLPGLRDQIEGQSLAIVSGPMNAYFRIIQIKMTSQAGYAKWKEKYATAYPNQLWLGWIQFPEQEGTFPAFFTNRLTFDDMLAANRAINLRN